VRTWAPVAHTPIVRHRLSRDHLSAIGLVTLSPRRGRVGAYLRLFDGAARGEDFIDCLRHILRHFKGPVIVVWDRLGAHRSKAVAAFVAKHPRLSLELLPPYAPELNPVDHLWSPMKRGDGANHSAQSLEELERVVLTRWSQMTSDHLKACLRATRCGWTKREKG
jgi:transposase